MAAVHSTLPGAEGAARQDQRRHLERLWPDHAAASTFAALTHRRGVNEEPPLMEFPRPHLRPLAAVSLPKRPGGFIGTGQTAAPTRPGQLFSNLRV